MGKRVPGEGGAETAPSQEQCLPFTSCQLSGTSNSTSASRSPALTAAHHATLGKPVHLSEPVSPPAQGVQGTLPTCPGGCREVIPGRDMTTQDSR